jgi:ribonuclease VapC
LGIDGNRHSAIVALLLDEPECESYIAQITAAERRLVSAVSVVEAGIVLESRRGDAAAREFDLFLRAANLEIVPVDAEQAEAARAAWRKYGKGRHPAALNLGDCFTYALAQITGEPLLAKGRDFAQTGLPLAGQAGPER